MEKKFNQNNVVKYGITMLLSLQLAFFPLVSFAQEAVVANTDMTQTRVAVEVDPEVVIVQSVSSIDTQAGEISQEIISPQITETNQSEAEQISLQATFDPHSISVSENASTTIAESLPEELVVVPDTTASSTPLEIISPTEEPLTSVEPDSSGETATTTTPVILVPPAVSENTLEVPPEIPVSHVSLSEPERHSKFTFNIRGGKIDAQKSRDSQRGEGGRNKNRKLDVLVTEIPNLLPDSVTGALNVSGVCTEKYFVVLVYKHQEDYDNNPASYIFNKAFDCINGNYSYAIKDLPESLPAGTYYLLIGGQGDDSWRPITALVPIDIQRQ